MSEFTDDQLTAFETAVRVCADSVDKLRACDVFRAIGLVFDQGPDMQTREQRGAHTFAFTKWLREKRPDLSTQIDADAEAVIEAANEAEAIEKATAKYTAL